MAPPSDPECRFNFETRRCEPQPLCRLRFRVSIVRIGGGGGGKHAMSSKPVRLWMVPLLFKGNPKANLLCASVHYFESGRFDCLSRKLFAVGENYFASLLIEWSGPWVRSLLGCNATMWWAFFW